MPAIAREAPDNDSRKIADVAAGDEFRMLDRSRGWAWGYLADGRVAYLAADAVGA